MAASSFARHGRRCRAKFLSLMAAIKLCLSPYLHPMVVVELRLPWSLDTEIRPYMVVVELLPSSSSVGC
jgi:hypothetical protein